jgi:hypothetical protein
MMTRPASSDCAASVGLLAPNCAGVRMRRTTAWSCVSVRVTSSDGISSGRHAGVLEREAQPVAVGPEPVEGGAVDHQRLDMAGRAYLAAQRAAQRLQRRHQPRLQRGQRIPLLDRPLRDQPASSSKDSKASDQRVNGLLPEGLAPRVPHKRNVVLHGASPAYRSPRPNTRSWNRRRRLAHHGRLPWRRRHVGQDSAGRSSGSCWRSCCARFQRAGSKSAALSWAQPGLEGRSGALSANERAGAQSSGWRSAARRLSGGLSGGVGGGVGRQGYGCGSVSEAAVTGAVSEDMSRGSRCTDASKTSAQCPHRTQPCETLSWSVTTLNIVPHAGQRVIRLI